MTELVDLNLGWGFADSGPEAGRPIIMVWRNFPADEARRIGPFLAQMESRTPRPPVLATSAS